METNVPISNMGKRNMSAPAMSCDASASSSSADDVGSAQLQDLLRRMPTQYALSTSFADRMHHAKLLAEASDAAKAQQHSVRLSWDAEQRGGRAAIWLVFPDRRGSLGVITSLLSELGVNIGKASVFSSSDGLLAVDTFTVDRMDAALAEMLRARLAQALSSPWSSEAVTDWSTLSLGTAEAPPPTATAQLPPGPAMPPPQQQLPQMPLLSETPALNQNPSGWTEEEVSMLNGLQGQFSNLRVRKLIDEGASSQVWEGEWAGARVVIKVLREQEALRSFLSEVNIWRQLRHPCVCALLGVCMFDERPSMVLEYMTGGSLHDLLHNATDGVDIDTPLLTRMVVEVASGVAYLHANGVMHRDVKTANVLLDDARHAKVTDFGISTRFGRKDYTAETGTYRQMAPEVILHKPYNYKCDVYSYGVLLWEALHRQVPFTGFAPLQAAFAVAMEHQRPPINLREDLKVYQPLIEACWDSEPTNRPDMDQVVRVTAECAQSIETGSFNQGQQPAAGSGSPSANSSAAPAPRGLRGLTTALAGRLAGVNLRRPSTPQD